MQGPPGVVQVRLIARAPRVQCLHRRFSIGSCVCVDPSNPPERPGGPLPALARTPPFRVWPVYQNILRSNGSFHNSAACKHGRSPMIRSPHGCYVTDPGALPICMCPSHTCIGFCFLWRPVGVCCRIHFLLQASTLGEPKGRDANSITLTLLRSP